MVKTPRNVVTLAVENGHQASADLIAQSHGADKVASSCVHPLRQRERRRHGSGGYVPAGGTEMNRIHFVPVSHASVCHRGTDDAAAQVVPDDRALRSIRHFLDELDNRFHFGKSGTGNHAAYRIEDNIESFPSYLERQLAISNGAEPLCKFLGHELVLHFPSLPARAIVLADHFNPGLIKNQAQQFGLFIEKKREVAASQKIGLLLVFLDVFFPSFGFRQPFKEIFTIRQRVSRYARRRDDTSGLSQNWNRDALFLDGRHVGKSGKTLLRERCNDSHLAGASILSDLIRIFQHQVHMSAQQISNSLGAAWKIDI